MHQNISLSLAFFLSFFLSTSILLTPLIASYTIKSTVVMNTYNMDLMEKC